MKFFIGGTYKDLSRKAAADVIKLMQKRKYPVICTASGDSPSGLYKVLVDKNAGGFLDTTNWNFVGLDEWVGLNGEDEGSCRFHLDNEIFNPLKITKDRICFFNGRAITLQKECENVENFIQKNGGLDIVIVGLGLNGHVGMNEPGTAKTARAHVTVLDDITKQTGQKYFKNEQPLKDGITLGLETIMEAKNILLIVSGAHKAAIVKQVIEGEISDAVPASLFRNHPGLRIYLDTESAALLSEENYF